jgi:hypothetical protein
LDNPGEQKLFGESAPAFQCVEGREQCDVGPTSAPLGEPAPAFQCVEGREQCSAGPEMDQSAAAAAPYGAAAAANRPFAAATEARHTAAAAAAKTQTAEAAYGAALRAATEQHGRSIVGGMRRAFTARRAESGNWHCAFGIRSGHSYILGNCGRLGGMS